jgi:hypothetical protein
LQFAESVSLRSPAQRPGPSCVPAATFYLLLISLDAARKVAGLPASVIGIVYIATAGVYLAYLRYRRTTHVAAPRYLPVILTVLTLWCIGVAIAQNTPIEIALLGIASYIYFVPLVYIGAALMSDNAQAIKALRVVAISGGIIGAGAILSAILGQSAPALLQPIIPSAGIHSSDVGNIYLAPSIFATAEEASEQILISLFAWMALVYTPGNKIRRSTSSILLALLFGGLFAAERRTDIDVAVLGLFAVVFLNRTTRRMDSAHTPLLHVVEERGRIAIAVMLSALGCVILLAILGGGRLVSFLTSESPWKRILLMFSPADLHGLAGQGPGTSTQGAGIIGATTFNAINNSGQYVAYTIGNRVFMTAEGGLTKTWLELGLMGVLLYLFVFVSLLAPMIRMMRALDGAGRALLVLAIAVGVVFLKGHQSLDNPLVQPMYWLVVGGIWGRLHAAQNVPDSVLASTGPAPGVHRQWRVGSSS